MKAAFSQAGKTAARFMSAQLRAEASMQGWPSHVAQSLHVSFDGDTFSVMSHGNPEHVKDLEYGTETTPPSAVIHRFGNRTGAAESLIADLMKGETLDLPAI